MRYLICPTYLSAIIFVFAAFAGALHAQSDSQSLPAFDLPEENHTRSGYIQLRWIASDEQIESAIQFEVQQSVTASFDDSLTIYTGSDLGTYLSGLESGVYYYRVRAVQSDDEVLTDWSEPIILNVEHHSMGVTITLLLVGGLVFLLTVGVVVHGTVTTST